jgi:hypothetical protein
MIFKILLTMSLILTAGTSAYMSVFGLMSVFGSSAKVVGLMGFGLELGKILIVIYVHRSWYKLKLAHKLYYVLVVFALVLLTSVEIIGYLSQSHSITAKSESISAARIASLEIERENLQDELSVLEKTLDGLPKTYVSKRLSERRKAGYYPIRKRLAEIEVEIGGVREARIVAKLEAGPIFAVAGLFNVDSGIAIIVFILALVGVVEPLSVGIAVAVSSVWGRPESPVVEQKDQKVGKMSKSHVERIQRKLVVV